MKAKIINENYVCGSDERLTPVPSWAWIDDPWRAIGGGKVKRFPTHAEAIRYADELATALREVP